MAECKKCGKYMNPADYMISDICLKCTKKAYTQLQKSCAMRGKKYI